MFKMRMRVLKKGNSIYFVYGNQIHRLSSNIKGNKSYEQEKIYCNLEVCWLRPTLVFHPQVEKLLIFVLKHADSSQNVLIVQKWNHVHLVKWMKKTVAVAINIRNNNNTLPRHIVFIIVIIMDYRNSGDSVLSKN